MKKTLLITVLFILLVSCQKATDWPIPDQKLNLITVDGILTDELKTQMVRIFHTVNQLNQAPLPVTGADVIISNEDSAWVMQEQPGKPGIYLSAERFIAISGKTYTLLIYVNGIVYSAKASMAPGSEFTELRYQKNENNDLYHISWVANAFNTDQPAMWEVLLDWSGVPGFEAADSLSCHGRMLFYTLPTLDVSEIFAPEMEKISFPAGTLITEKRYSLTNEHAEFLRDLLLETNWQGGLFDSAPANGITNLSDGACGFFGVCAVNTLYITVKP